LPIIWLKLCIDLIVETLLPVLSSTHSHILLIAPPAWGKTYRLIEMMKHSPDLWIFVSPLRALADEFYLKVIKYYNTVLIRSGSDWGSIQEQLPFVKMVIVTPETYCFKSIANISKKKIFVLDEFHLFYYWGDSFRERLREFYENIVSDETCSILSLTATMKNEYLDRWKAETDLNFEVGLVIDQGNQQLKNNPVKTVYFNRFMRKKIQRDIQVYLLSHKRLTVLIFVKYRSEVDYWKNFYQEMGYQCLGCKGGEASLFIDQLRVQPSPDIIIATTVLSHGVNLPKIGRIYFLYPVLNKDFWIQMTGRGGRKGEAYQCFTMDKDEFNVWQRIFWMLKCFFKDYYNRLIIGWNELR